jgi:hypothetical protein
LELPMSPRWSKPDARIDAIRGSVAVERGPLVMCVESVDLPEGRGVEEIRLDPGRDLEERNGATIAPGRLVDIEDRDWPYRGRDEWFGDRARDRHPPRPLPPMGKPGPRHDAGLSPNRLVGSTHLLDPAGDEHTGRLRQ